MGKFFLKKVDGVDDLVKVVNKPIWGKVPDFYRGTDWNIDDQWYTCNGTDILNSTDPFGDQSLIRKFMFNGDYVDKVTGTVTAVPGGTHNHFQTSGPFGTKCLTVEDAETGTNYINCGNVTRTSLEGFTISGWVRVVDNSSLLAKRAPDTGSGNSYWNTLWKLESPLVDVTTFGNRTPAVYYNAITGMFANDAADNVTAATVNIESQFYVPNVVSEWIHVTQVVNKFTIKIYINGVLFNEVATLTNENYLGDAILKLGDSTRFSTNCSYKSIELYKRDLTHVEVKALYNQQLFNEVLCDGSNPTYKPFTYLSEKEKLVRVVTDEAGNVVKYELVKKPGYIASTDNVVKFENGQLVDRYGKNVLSGNINRLLHFSSTVYVNITTNATWGTALTADIELNTDKYDYLFMYNTGLNITNTVAASAVGGADINISIGNVPIVTNGHRGLTSIGTTAVIMDFHSQVDTLSPLITQGYKGKFKVRCSLSRYSQDSSSVTVRNLNNGGAYSGKGTPSNLSTLTVYELNKASNDLV